MLQHWDSKKNQLDCALDGTSLGPHTGFVKKGLAGCQRESFGGPDSVRVKRQVSRGVPADRHPKMTFVTALIDIGRYNRPRCLYLEYMRGLLKVDVNMVIFIEPWAEQFVRDAR